MSIIRLRFTKGDEVKYISHLDLMRTFQRAIRRSDIDVMYSQGFNPHQEISFGAPLALGTTSDAEYVDIKMMSDVDITILIKNLNQCMPIGLPIINGVVLNEKAKNAMSVVNASLYNIIIKLNTKIDIDIKKGIEDFLNRDSIVITKEQFKKPNKVTEVDIKKSIRKIKMLDIDENKFSFDCLLDCGSQNNLKPELLIEAIKDFLSLDIRTIKIHRKELLAIKNDLLVDLLEVGEK